MGFFSNIKEWFMGLFNRTDIGKATGINPRISEGMMDDIELWRDIYGNTPPWKKTEFDKSMGFAKTVCRDIASKCTSEGKIETGDEATDKSLMYICSKLPENAETMLALGAVVARPFFDAVNNRIDVGWYSADRVVPLSWQNDELVSAALLDFVAVTKDGGNRETFVKIETHKWHNGSTTITSNAYVWNDGRIGAKVPLATVTEWESISDEPIEINNLTRPMFVYFKTPIKNNIDGSNVGVSIFANAIDQLEELDKVFSHMVWEGQAGEAKVFVAESMIPQKMVNGKPVNDLSAADKKMYKVLDGGVENHLFEVATPNLRFEQYKVEMDSTIALACKNMGLDAKSFTVERSGGAVTATQVITDQNDTYTTVLNIQEKVLKPCLYKVIDSIRALQSLYGFTDLLLPESNDDITVSFGDSIIIDEESEKRMAMEEVGKGLRSKLSYIMEYRGMSEADAIVEIERIKNDAPVMDFFGNGTGL